jgi:alpha-amylase
LNNCSSRGLCKCRKRNKIVATSALDIKLAEDGLYIAEVGGRLLVKLGGRMDMGTFEVKEGDGWKFVMHGKDFAVWERAAEEVRPCPDLAFVCLHCDSQSM